MPGNTGMLPPCTPRAASASRFGVWAVSSSVIAARLQRQPAQAVGHEHHDFRVVLFLQLAGQVVKVHANRSLAKVFGRRLSGFLVTKSTERTRAHRWAAAGKRTAADGREIWRARLGYSQPHRAPLHCAGEKRIMRTELTWLGHASWLIRAGGQTILLDPFLSDSPAAPVKPEQVAADYVLVSHGHFDHVGDAAAIANRTGATVIAVYEICDWLSRQHGVAKTEAMNVGGSIALPFGRVKLTPAWHSSTLPDGASGGNPVGFLLALPQARFTSPATRPCSPTCGCTREAPT